VPEAPANWISRREFTQFGLGALSAGALAFWATSATRAQAGSFHHRPPGAGGARRGGTEDGAVAEARFLEQCVRCGQCAGPCPEQAFAGDRRKAIQFRGVDAGPLAGTPFIEPRRAPCLMCVEVPCVKACPTGALDPRLTNINDARMGTACIVDREGCLAIQGLRCEVCYTHCPVRNHAITLERTVNPRTSKHAILEPVVRKEACTGCGICEHVCPREETVIKVGSFIPAARDSDRFYQFKGTKPA
jgi:ferredoxin-type protein NapG